MNAPTMILGYGDGSTKASRMHLVKFIRYLFTAVCILAMLTYGHFLSTLASTVRLLPVIGHEHIHEQNHGPSKASSNMSTEDLQQCGIWMAPSSLRPFPGYGIFTTRDIDHGKPILNAPDAVSIPLHDMRRRNEYIPLYEERRRLWKNVFSNYVWAHGVPDHSRYDHPPDIVDFQPGFGSLPNHHCLLQSLRQAPPIIAPYNDALLPSDHNNSRTSPGIGAFSYHAGRNFYAKRDLKAGEEIFLNYGYCQRHHPVEEDTEMSDDSPWHQKLIYPEDVKEAARLLLKHKPFGSKPWPKGNVTAALVKLIADESSSSPAKFTPYSDPNIVLSILSKAGNTEDRRLLYEVVDKIQVQSKARIAKAIGRDLVNIKDSYKTLARKKLWFELANMSLERKDPEWIKENGLCLEHLIPKKSTLPHAGFGGFAQYRIIKNQIVVPAPVLHITNKETLTLYQRGIVGDRIPLFEKNPSSFKIGTSLLLNYCFGHSSSSMLMCPMTSAMLINHCSNRSKECGQKGPNAKVRWSSGWDPKSLEWRNKTLNEIEYHAGRVLSLEIIALRDIAPNEEVFIDYGPDWENAWDQHVRSWNPPAKIQNFISAKEANELRGPILDELISNDLRKIVHHPYLFTGCQYDAWPDVENIGNYTKKWKNRWKELSDAEILEKFSSPGDQFSYQGVDGYVGHEEYSHWPCSVLYAEKQKGRYTVRIHMSPLKDVEPYETSWNKNELPRILTNYSQESIHYFVNPSDADQVLPNVFRHSIGFPDDLFPLQWKNGELNS